MQFGHRGWLGGYGCLEVVGDWGVLYWVRIGFATLGEVQRTVCCWVTRRGDVVVRLHRSFVECKDNTTLRWRV